MVAVQGAASQMFERHAHRDAGHGSRLASVSASACSADGRDGSSSDFDPAFLAAFGQANVGDTSPNVLGAFCQDTGGRSSLISCTAALIRVPVRVTMQEQNGVRVFR